MVPPVTVSRDAAPDWAALGPDDKRTRVLDAAKDVFTAQGLDAPMPAVADAAGIGVGSLYRCFDSKHELIAALAVQQLGLIEAEVATAQGEPDAWAALERTVREIAEHQATNKLVSGALSLASERRDVAAALASLSLAWQHLIDDARHQGTVRGDATVADVRLAFAALRAAEEVSPGGPTRMLDLFLDAMRARG